MKEERRERREGMEPPCVQLVCSPSSLSSLPSPLPSSSFLPSMSSLPSPPPPPPRVVCQEAESFPIQFCEKRASPRSRVSPFPMLSRQCLPVPALSSFSVVSSLESSAEREEGRKEKGQAPAVPMGWREEEEREEREGMDGTQYRVQLVNRPFPLLIGRAKIIPLDRLNSLHLHKRWVVMYRAED